MAEKHRKGPAAGVAAPVLAPIEAMLEAVLVVDRQGRITAMNAAAEQLTGWDRAEASGQMCQQVLHLAESGEASQDDPVQRCLRDRQVVRMNTWQEHELLARDGRRARILLCCTPIEKGALVAVLDVSQQSLLARELQYRLTHDSVTGLLNREAMDRSLAEALTQTRSTGGSHLYCHIDLDQFRIVNDSLGHGAGDECLREIAAHLRARMAPEDVLARVGGDHFGALLRGCDRHSGATRVDALLSAIRGQKFSWGRRRHVLTCSVGAIEIDGRAPGSAEIMALAEATALAAQFAGRDRVIYARGTDELTQRRRTEMDTVAQLRDALEGGGFELHSEDVVEVRNPGRVVYRELLVRMRDAGGALVPPEAFVPAAERFSLIGALDRWVVRAAIAELARRPADGVVHAINLSGMSLSDDQMLGYVEDLLQEFRLQPERICFEITETATISRLSDAVQLMTRLRRLGCQFALDDFGAGMASFSYLKTLPVDYLKIDGSFVSAMRNSRTNQGMVEAIHRVGTEMGLKTIAEHVEDKATLRMLHELGVHYAQGRCIATAQPFLKLRKAG